MEKILNKCPICGAKLEYNHLMQYTNVYKILQNGQLSKNRIRKNSDCPMEAAFISCTNEDCNFATDCDLDVNCRAIDCRIFQDGETFMIDMFDD